MKFDQENMFYDKTSSIATSNVIANVGGGDAANPLFIVIHSDATEAAARTFTLQTSDAENFSPATTLATITTKAAKGVIAAQKLPYGLKKYIRLTSAATPTGNISAGLVEDVENWY